MAKIIQKRHLVVAYFMTKLRVSKNAKPLNEETNCVDGYAKTRNAGSLGEQEMRVMN